MKDKLFEIIKNEKLTNEEIDNLKGTRDFYSAQEIHSEVYKLPDIKPDSIIQKIRLDFYDSFPLNLLIDDMITPAYIAYDFIITRDIYNAVNEYNNEQKSDKDKIKVSLDGGNLMGYVRYKKHFNDYHFMPWDDDIDLACFIEREFNNQDFYNILKKLIDKDYIVTMYLKEKTKPYSLYQKHHILKEFSSFGWGSSINELLTTFKDYEVILFNINIHPDKYIKFLKEQKIEIDRQLFYDPKKESIVRPSVDMFFYTNNNKTDNKKYVNNKFFGFPSAKEYGFNFEFIEKLNPIKYNNLIDVNIPNNSDQYFKEIYGSIDKLYFKKHTSKLTWKDYSKLNNYDILYNNKMILKLVEIYNMKVNEYFKLLDA